MLGSTMRHLARAGVQAAQSGALASVLPALATARSTGLLQAVRDISSGGLGGSSSLGEAMSNLRRGFRSSGFAAEATTIEVPPMGDSVSEGAIASIEKQVGEIVREDDVIAQIETDKVTIDVRYTGSVAAVIKEILVAEDDTVVVGQPVCTVDSEGVEQAAPVEAPKVEEAPKVAAPAAPATPPPAAPKTPEPAAPPPAAAAAERVERPVKMTRLRKRIADRLKGAQNTYAMLTTFNEVDMTALMDMRAQYKDAFLDKHGAKLGFMSCFVKAAGQALQEIPAVNAVIDGDDIVYRDYTDISIAVATPKGLVVPVLRDVQNMTFADCEGGMVSLAKKARDGTLSIDEMAGGTFTISNGGVYGSLLSTPIINPPQSAIMGMHSIQKRPMVMGNEILPRPMMYLALTYDHRLIDGREAVTFLKRVKELVEDPRRFLLEV